MLLIERFDRSHTAGGSRRRARVSALTLLVLDERMARPAGYADLADIIRQRFTNPRDTLREMFGRLVFNILCGNTDDHARNHAAFWDGARLALTPAYDICRQSRTGTDASQAMHIPGTHHESQLSVCLEAAANVLLTATDAETIICGQIAVIGPRFEAVRDAAGLSQADRARFATRPFLNPYPFDGLPEGER
jgi:serine/threonine-protein kinase HipA